MGENFMILEDKLTMHFDNPASNEYHFGCQTEKTSPTSRLFQLNYMQGKYEKYIMLAVLQNTSSFS